MHGHRPLVGKAPLCSFVEGLQCLNQVPRDYLHFGINQIQLVPVLSRFERSIHQEPDLIECLLLQLAAVHQRKFAARFRVEPCAVVAVTDNLEDLGLRIFHPGVVASQQGQLEEL